MGASLVSFISYFFIGITSCASPSHDSHSLLVNHRNLSTCLRSLYLCYFLVSRWELVNSVFFRKQGNFSLCFPQKPLVIIARFYAVVNHLRRTHFCKIVGNFQFFSYYSPFFRRFVSCQSRKL